MHDDMQAMRVLQMDKCFKDGQIPCRWVPDMGYGYGYPQFIYYSPLPYYVMEVFHLIGFQIIDSVKIGIILGFILSGISMFLLGRSLWGNLGGLVSASFYLYAPYHASDIYTRGAMGEFWALVFLPVIFWSVLELIKSGKVKFIIYLAMSFGGLLLTHNITTIAFTPGLLVWIIFLLLLYKKENIKKILLGIFWGFGLSAFYTLPVVFEKKFAHTETMIAGYFNYLAHFVSVNQLFLSTFWGYGSSELGPYDDLSFSIGIIFWVVALIVLIISIFLRKKDKKTFRLVCFFVIFGLSAVFMTHQKSSFIWKSLPVLAYFQFPWRFLTIISFAFSTIAGALIYYLKNSKAKIALTCSLILTVIITNAFYFNPSAWFNISDKEKFSGELWQKQLTISIFDYLPIFAVAPPDKQAPKIPYAIAGEIKVIDYRKGSDWQKGEIEVNSPDAKVVIPLYYFPGFKVWVDNKPTEVKHDNFLGLITVNILNGKHDITVKLTRTPVRVIGDGLTLLSFALLLFVLLKRKYVKET